MRGRLAGPWYALLLAACHAPEPSHDSSVITGELGDYFEVVDTVVLLEDPRAPITDIGDLAEASNGDLLIVDRLVPHVRRFSATGQPIASLGDYGEGPFEFHQTAGVAERGGDVVVVDPRLSRVTILGMDLRPDTTLFVLPRPRGGIARLGDSYLLATVSGRRSSGFTLFSREWEPLWNEPAPSPDGAVENPYWGSYATNPLAVVGSSIVAAYSFAYPMYIYDSHGGLVDKLGSPSARFRPVPVVERGAFSGSDGQQRRREWLASFDVIVDIRGVRDDLLVVTHGGLRYQPDAGRISRRHQSMDVYHVPSRRKIAEDLRLPAESRVVGSGPEAIFLLVDQPPERWTLVKLVPRSIPSSF